MALTFMGAAVVVVAMTSMSTGEDDGAWVRPRCVVCRRAIDPSDDTVEGDRGGFIPMAFTGEPTVELWVHDRCLARPDRALDGE